MVTFANNFKSRIYDRGCHHRYLPCSATLQNSQRTVVAAPASNVESGEIEDDEF